MPKKSGDSDREEYLDIRKLYMQGEQQAYENFDKSILTISSSAFGFSIALVQFLPPARDYAWLLGAAWVGFIVSILLTLLSYLQSQKAFRIAIDILDAKYYEASTSPPSENVADLWTNYLNLSSLVSLITGVVFLAAFVYINLP